MPAGEPTDTVRDSAAADAAASGWERTVERLVRERGEALQRYAILLTGNPDDAADAVQDALVRTFSRLQNGFTIERAEAYVRRAIANRVVDKARRGSRWRRIAPLVFESDERPAANEAADRRLDLAGQLQRLSPRERACIVLRYYEDLKVDDVAAVLGISSGAVKRYLSDAMAKLSDALIDDHPPAASGVLGIRASGVAARAAHGANTMGASR